MDGSGRWNVTSEVGRPGARVIFDAPRTDWPGLSHGMHVNLVGDVLHDLIDVEFDREPGAIYLCKRSLLQPASDITAREQGPA